MRGDPKAYRDGGSEGGVERSRNGMTFASENCRNLSHNHPERHHRCAALRIRFTHAETQRVGDATHFTATRWRP